ncbi:hypothetical protein L9F63_022447 [Diploptera punctata]|uniref:Uncharacterized protein n=1 Tax=Diploptera punctata TaxID=6984 RepID=A0AAD7ZMM9_DIPPU|nr:hypothetical protein L9F63_022447 [Diploptera punctata]
MSNLYEDLHTPFTKRLLNKFPHYVIPGLSLQCDEDLENEMCSSYKYTKPLPYLPPVSVSHKDNRLCKRLENLISSENKIWDAPRRDSFFMELVISNPDREFDGKYNWYYTGGSLATMKMGDRCFLITTFGLENDHIRAVELIDVKKHWEPSLSHTTATCCKPDQPIYQVQGSCDTGYLCVRQRNNCHLLQLTEVLDLQRAYSINCDSVFTSIALSPHKTGSSVTLTSRREIKEREASGRIVYKHTVPLIKTLEDDWCSISYNSDDPHGLVFADRNCIWFLDKRKAKLCTKLSPKSETKCLDSCEDMSLIFQSCINTNAWYICSSHSVMLYDIRSPSNPLQCWKHHLCSPPLLHSTLTCQQNEEVVCMASQDPSEVVTIVNKWDGDVLNTQSYPQSLPSLRDTFLAARNCALWLDPAVEHRTKLGLTGLTWLPTVNSELALLSQTSAGDVFKQMLITDSDSNCDTLFTKKEDLKCLANWEEVLLRERTSDSLHFTSRKSMDFAYKYIKGRKKKLSDYKVFENDHRQPWEFSKAHLESYVDVLAPRILETWEIEDIPEWRINKKDLRSEPLPEQVNKVEAWLTSLCDRNVENQSNTSCKNKERVSTTYEQTQIQEINYLEEDTSYSQFKRKYDENSDFELNLSKKKKLQIIPKEEYVLGF